LILVYFFSIRRVKKIYRCSSGRTWGSAVSIMILFIPAELEVYEVFGER